MKSKVIFFLAGAAVVTLSFTFATASRAPKAITKNTPQVSHNEPVGGLLSEDKF
ncbi:hypothetical protein [Chryseolinea lacunae]|uniref:Uncharacterized protein n=1 Tax=Chryseolinea lacunae TaxID=2801331 RepID=A0ABS1L1X5_9BACT|nr:hypothetical protein [Chryseolinea lacunae]MBL0744937.1 hypothetical protein [Chryseolinea lacunae]